MFTAISLFSGAVDGLAIAAQAAGFNVTHHVEWDAWCCRVLRMNHPGSIVLNKDIHDVHDLPPADIIFGGSPCQGWSAAGNQLGFSDPRYLWPEMLRIVRESKPRVVIHENVRGGVSEGLLDQICNDLESAGYETTALVFPACVFGAPHERYRFFVIGLMAYTRSFRQVANSAEQEPSNNSNGINEASERGRRAEFYAGESGGTDVGNPKIERLETYDPKPIGSNSRLLNGQSDEAMVNSTSNDYANIGTSARVTQFGSESAGSNRSGGTNPIDDRTQLRQLPNEEREILQPGMGSTATRNSSILHRLDPVADFPGFPAGQGFYQYPYEPPRTTQKKSAYAKERIQAHGNACVPQQCAPIFRAVVRWLQEN